MTLELLPWPRDDRFLVRGDGVVFGPRGSVVGTRARSGHLLVSGRRPGGARFCVGAHYIVCETFHGPRPPGMDAAHTNGVPDDNQPENLSWKTRSGNAADRIRHGTNGRKLTAADVLAIRAAPHESRRVLADRFGVTPGMISHIRTGHSWSAL